MAKPKRKAPAPKAVKGAVLQIRISEDDKAELVEAAARDGRELSAWVRWVALREARDGTTRRG